jgi:hypothetical protein
MKKIASGLGLKTESQLKYNNNTNLNKIMTINDIIKKLNLKSKEFCEFAGLSKNKFNHEIRKNDPIYQRGLQIKLREFLEYKIKQIKKEIKS